MVVKLFILGLPGSGKSAASRYIKHFAEENQWLPQRFKDYEILYRMYKENDLRFCSTEDRGYDGFDVLGLSAFDDALTELNLRIEEREKSDYDEKELLIIEFSRDDYYIALLFFVLQPLQDTYILFINADIEICKSRINERVKHRESMDDNYVSKFIFDIYYERDHKDYLQSVALQLVAHFGIRRENIHVIDNGPEVSEEEFHRRVTAFASNILHLKA